MIKRIKYKKSKLSLVKVFLPGLLFLVVLLSIFSLSNNTKVITSLSRLFYGENEIALDNWEISTVFYDSSVNNGQTPLTEINWDASDGGYGTGAARTIIVEIYYKNSNPVINYNKGDIKITLPALIKGKSQDYVFWEPLLDVRKNVGANDSSHSGYDWNYTFTNNTFYFTNDKEIIANSPLEGTIQISYVMTPRKEDSAGWEQATIEKYDSTCLHKYNSSINAKINNTIESNYIDFNYQRTYTHEWTYSSYNVAKSAQMINSYDLPYKLTRQIDDYYWVKYMFNTSFSNNYNYLESYPYIPKTELLFEDYFPPNTLVYCVNNDEPVSLDNGRMYYPIKLNKLSNYNSARSTSAYFIVGYKKSEIESTIIDNTVKMFANYDDGTSNVFLSESNINFDLNDYTYSNSGNMFSLTQFHDSKDGKRYYRYLTNNDFDHYCGYDFKNHPTNYIPFGVEAHTTYTGNDMTIELGSDLVYISDSTDSYRRLKENEYRYTYLATPYVYNGEGQELKVNLDLYIRSANNDSYEFYKTVKSGRVTLNIPSELNVVEYYYKITTDVSMVFKDYNYSNRVQLKIDDEIAYPSGKIYTYSYLKVFEEDNNGTLVLKNKMVSSDYDNFAGKQSLIDYDLENNGDYIQRATSFHTYDDNPVVIDDEGYEADGQFVSSDVVQNASKEIFIGNAFNSVQLDAGGYYYNFGTERHDFWNDTKDEDYQFKFGKIYMYELLPEGMELYSTKNEVKNNITISQYEDFYAMDGEKLFKSQQEANSFFQEHLDLKILNNYNNTNRTMLVYEFDLSDEEFILFTEYTTIKSTYKYSISYDEIMSKGKNWTSYLYAKAYYSNENPVKVKGTSVKDNGYYDPDVVDLNNNGDTNETFGYKKKAVTISSVFSTNQDLQITAQTNHDNYSTGVAAADIGGLYTYKIRARTGNNDITNLVIYDSIEDLAKDSNMEFISSSGIRDSWNGEFLGVDTTNAEEKGYQIKVYYSEKNNPSNIKDDNSWHLYTDSVDKTKVKSLAFEYLNGEGEPAIIAANSITYVLVKMKAIDTDSFNYAYNGCWTEWNALDSTTGDISSSVTGINSNIVKVALPSSTEFGNIDLEIDKYWSDANSKMNIRPNTISIQLVPDGDLTKAINVPLGSTNVDPNNSNHWKTTISVPKYDLDGNQIAYTIRENEIILDNGYKYTPETNDYSVTNTLMKEIELKKIWNDNNNSYLTRPGNVTYKIKQNNTLYKEVNITGDYSTNEWTKTISVPVYDNSNNEYTYTLEEISIDNYSSTCSSFTCTNTLTGKETININKTWLDKNNEYNTRPDSIMVNILQNNNTYRGITLNSSNNWSNTIEVPKYDSNGVKYNYILEEESLSEYGLVEYNQSTYSITNTLKANTLLTITKHWVDDNNSSNTRPSELKITLLQNNNEYRELTLTGNTSTWTTTIEVPKYDNNQTKYKYSIREKIDNLNSDYSNITYSEEELSVTNTLNKNTNLVIKKKWQDDNNKYQTRPENVSINLLQDNEIYKTIQLSGDSNSWEATVNDVPVYDSNGKKYTYTIKETNAIEKYENITYDQTKLEITNELTDVPKVTLYFTVVNGYIDPVTGEMKYDDFGLNEIMKKYNINPEDEYVFTFELQNTDTGQIYEGKLSTQGILEFDDLPYGEYKAIEGDDKLFEFVDMLEIEEVNGVKFEKRGKEGYITIEPTGENIMYGAKIINKIEAPIVNPKTNLKGLFLLLTILIITIISFIFIKEKKELYK